MKIPVAKKQELGTCAVLYNSKGEILLGKRKNAYKAGQYVFREVGLRSMSRFMSVRNEKSEKKPVWI